MDPFKFEIVEVIPSRTDLPGDTTIAGHKIAGGDIAVGDELVVPLEDGSHARAAIVAFPLIRFNDSTLGAISLAGVLPQDVHAGGIATG